MMREGGPRARVNDGSLLMGTKWAPARLRAA